MASSGSVRRHPGDVLRLALGVAIVLTGAWLARGGRLGTLEMDLFRLVNRLPTWSLRPLVVVMQAGTLAAVGVTAVAALAARRRRLAVDLLLAGGSAWVAASLLKAVVERGRPAALLLEVAVRGHEQVGLGYPSGHAAVAAALATAAAPYVSRPARRALWGIAFAVAVGRVFVGAHLPADVVGGLALGWAIGAAVHLARGAPTHDPTPDEVLAGTRALGLDVSAVESLRTDARASRPFLLRRSDGSQAFAKVVSAEQRDADLLFKLWRYVVYRTVEDEAPFATPKRQTEHEAYVSLLAERAGVCVPSILAAGEAEGHAAILVQSLVRDATGLDGLPASAVDDDLLRRLWSQVATLHRARIAHRDLRTANVLVDGSGQPWLVDFGFAEGAASDRWLALDVAELLAATGALVGAERAVAAAATALKPEQLSAAARLLEPMALSTETRQRAHGHLNELREAIEHRTGAPVGRVERITRLRLHLRTVAAVLAAGVAIHLLLPLVAPAAGWGRLAGGLEIDWLLAAAVMAALMHVFAAVSLMGSVTQPLPLVRTTVAQAAASYTGRFAPDAAGRLGLNTRLLERAGVPRADAVTAVRADVAAGLVMHASVFLLTLTALDDATPGGLRLPEAWPLLAGVAAIGVAAALVAGFPTGRPTTLGPAFAALRALGPMLRRPVKASQLLGGSLGITLASIAALTASLRTFGLDTPVTEVALVALVGQAAGALVPVPGGIGVVEAVLVGGLLAFGVPAAPAVAAVLTYRLLTFWLPMLLGVSAFRWLQREHAV